MFQDNQSEISTANKFVYFVQLETFRDISSFRQLQIKLLNSLFFSTDQLQKQIMGQIKLWA